MTTRYTLQRDTFGNHDCGPLCSEHADPRDTSIDVTRVQPCDRCGSEPVEAYALPSGNIEAFCTACTEAPRYHGYVVKAVAL